MLGWVDPTQMEPEAGEADEGADDDQEAEA
jgi:hypothetical protein